MGIAIPDYHNHKYVLLRVCEILWVLLYQTTTNVSMCFCVKGWIPQRVMDQAASIVLLDYLKYLRQHVATIKGGA